jgi:hypothetical protein
MTPESCAATAISTPPESDEDEESDIESDSDLQREVDTVMLQVFGEEVDSDEMEYECQ